MLAEEHWGAPGLALFETWDSTAVSISVGGPSYREAKGGDGQLMPLLLLHSFFVTNTCDARPRQPIAHRRRWNRPVMPGQRCARPRTALESAPAQCVGAL